MVEDIDPKSHVTSRLGIHLEWNRYDGVLVYVFEYLLSVFLVDQDSWNRHEMAFSIILHHDILRFLNNVVHYYG